MMRRLGSFRWGMGFWGLLLLLPGPLGAEAAGPWKVCTQITWDLGARVGAEYPLSPRVSLKGDLGSTLFSLEGDFAVTSDLFVLYKVFEERSPVQVEVLAGLPYTMVVVGAQAAVVSFGASVDLGYQWENGVGVYGRVGGGFPVFIDHGRWSAGGKSFFWPDAAVELRWAV